MRSGLENVGKNSPTDGGRLFSLEVDRMPRPVGRVFHHRAYACLCVLACDMRKFKENNFHTLREWSSVFPLLLFPLPARWVVAVLYRFFPDRQPRFPPYRCGVGEEFICGRFVCN